MSSGGAEIRVRAYVEEACVPDLTEEAFSAALVDFRARAGDGSSDAAALAAILLQATRSAAAPRFAVMVPPGRPELALTDQCRAMPEVLALHANHERESDEPLIATHLAGCEICARTLERVHRAERAFAQGSEELPELELEPTIVDSSTARVETATPIESKPQPQVQASSTERSSAQPQPPASPSGTYRRRSGGLVGALKNLGRPR